MLGITSAEDSPRIISVTVVLTSAMAVGTVASPLVGLLAPYLREEIAMQPASVGLLVAIYAAVSAIASWPAGTFTDRVGGGRALILVFAGSGVALVAIALATSYEFLVGAMVIAGFANSLVNPSTNHVIAESIARGARGLVAGIKMAGVQIGVFAAGLLIPFFAGFAGWRVPLAIGAVIVSTVGAVAVLRLIKHPRYEWEPGRSSLQWSAGLLVLTAYSLLMSAGASASLTYLSLYSVDQLGASPGVGAVSVAIAGLLAVGGRLFWGRATERGQMVMKPLLVISAASLVSSLLLLGAVTTRSPVFWIGTATLGFFALSFSAATTVALIVTVAARQTGSASGVMFVGFLVGFGVGPAGFGLAVESGGYTIAWIGVALVFALSAILAWAAVIWGSKDHHVQTRA